MAFEAGFKASNIDSSKREGKRIPDIEALEVKGVSSEFLPSAPLHREKDDASRRKTDSGGQG